MKGGSNKEQTPHQGRSFAEHLGHLENDAKFSQRSVVRIGISLKALVAKYGDQIASSPTITRTVSHTCCCKRWMGGRERERPDTQTDNPPAT